MDDFDDMSGYIRLTEATQNRSDVNESQDGSSVGPLMENINDTIFKLRSYYELDGSAEYNRGVEEGLSLAADLLEKLVERHNGQGR